MCPIIVEGVWRGAGRAKPIRFNFGTTSVPHASFVGGARHIKLGPRILSAVCKFRGPSNEPLSKLCISDCKRSVGHYALGTGIRMLKGSTTQ